MPNSAFPANSAVVRNRMLPAKPILRAPSLSVFIPRRCRTRSDSGPRLAAIAKAGALRHSSIRVRARAYSTGLPQTAEYVAADADKLRDARKDFDEPTQGVDIGAKAEIHKIIRKLAAQGLAVLMISSELPEILGMSDRIAVMRGGAIAAGRAPG